MNKRENLHRPKLEKGDRVILLDMHGESALLSSFASPGETHFAGSVTKVVLVFGNHQYEVNWDNKKFNSSNLQILSDVDDYMRESDYYEVFPNRRKKVDESIDPDFARKNKNLVQDFEMAKMYKFYEDLRKSSVVNMITGGVTSYFWMGKDRIAHEHYYTDMNDEQSEAFEQVLDSADDIKNILISGSLKTLEREEKEVTLDAVKKVAERKAKQIVVFIQQIY